MARHQVVVLALPGVFTFDLGCAVQVFARAPGGKGVPGHYDLMVCTPGGRAVRTADGFSMTVAHGLGALGQAETVVVPGYNTIAQRPSAAVLAALTDAADRSARVMSICVGAFALAYAGLLDGHRATTHWAYAGMLADKFPRIDVVPGVLYVDEGQILTSAGLAAGLDLGLHVVRRDQGAAAAAELARWNVVAPHRDGGQAQFVRHGIVPAGSAGGLGATRGWALARLDQPLTLSELSAHAQCSERTLCRRFKAETGQSPQQWLRRVRLQRARELLESTAEPIEAVARASGFPTPAALRMLFRTELSTTPTAYRRAFRGNIQT